MAQQKRADPTATTGGLVPDWVLIRDLPSRIQEYFGSRPSDHWLRDFFEAIRLGVLRRDGVPVLRHRVRELSYDPMESRRRPSDRGQPIGGAFGLQLSLHSEFDVSVYSWTDADLQLPNFDIALPRQPDGSIPPRHPIEVFWADVYEWERQRVMMGIAQVNTPVQTSVRPYNKEFFRSSYLMRVAKWKGDNFNGGNFAAPSSSDDVNWAASLFSGVSRATIRKVRKELAPPSWYRQGPKSGTKWRESST